METFNQIYADSFKTHWERPALSNYQGVTLYYKDVARKIAWFHTFFRECGITKGDKIAICSRNQSNWCVSFFSVITYGAVVVPLLHEFKPANIHHLVNHSGTKILFADTGILDNLDFEQMPGLMGIIRIRRFEHMVASYYAVTDERSLWWAKLMLQLFFITSLISLGCNILGRAYFFGNPMVLAVPALLF